MRSLSFAICSAMVVPFVAVVSFQPMAMPVRLSQRPMPMSIHSGVLKQPQGNAIRYQESNVLLTMPWNSESNKDPCSSSRRSRQMRSMAKKVLIRSAVAFGVMMMVQTQFAPAAIASEAPDEVLHIGQKLANYLSGFGLPKWAVLALISAMPVVELRGAIPVGVWMDLPITQVLPICVFGNMIPIVPLLYLLKNERLKKMMKPILDRAEKKASGLGVGSVEKQWVSLAAFVGIPLPGTGAWTGAMGAFLLGMPTLTAISSIFAGVVSAGCIMSAITLAGKKGGFAALAVLLGFAGKELISGSKEDEGGEAEESIAPVSDE